jgi:hypothetical protein
MLCCAGVKCFHAVLWCAVLCYVLCRVSATRVSTSTTWASLVRCMRTRHTGDTTQLQMRQDTLHSTPFT